MKAEKIIATYHRLRTQSLWKLLAADHGPTIVGLLQAHLYESDRTLPASILHERITRDLEELRAQGHHLPQTTKEYVSDWLTNGYLVRRFPSGATEEEYELSTTTAEAIRFLSGLIKPHSAATESRLALVINALVRLVEDTDRDKFRRIDRLMLEQTRIENEIKAIHQGKLQVLPMVTAIERVREIINLADELTGDFRHIHDQFEQLNRNLREKIMENEGSRGEVLDALFTGIDLITESAQGRTFSAFWRLLTDPEQSATLDEALDNVMSRDFMAELCSKERNFLLRLTRILLERGGMVHEVMQGFARSLKTFVQSREYLEQRHLNQLLKEALRTALTVKDDVKASKALDYNLKLTSSRLWSLSQWVLYDPALQAAPAAMLEGEKLNIDPDKISEMVAQSEIDFRTLKMNIHAVLTRCSQASIAEVLAVFPATQGLGSIVGLIVLGSRYGYKTDTNEKVTWTANDDMLRSAHIPKIFFLRERIDEFA